MDSGGHPRCCSGCCSSRPQPARAGRVGASEEALGGGNLTTRRAKRGTIVEVQPGPEAIYFTLPTICDQLPALDPDEAAAALEVRPLADDEWRQIEFVSRQDWTPIHEALDELARVEPNPVHAPLLSALYVRDELPTSLASLEIRPKQCGRSFPRALSRPVYGSLPPMELAQSAADSRPSSTISGPSTESSGRRGQDPRPPPLPERIRDR